MIGALSVFQLKNTPDNEPYARAKLKALTAQLVRQNRLKTHQTTVSESGACVSVKLLQAKRM